MKILRKAKIRRGNTKKREEDDGEFYDYEVEATKKKVEYIL
jgi:hypothetical protein